jgi:hypothetical protein
MLPLPVNLYQVYPPDVPVAGEPVVDAAATVARTITTPEPLAELETESFVYALPIPPPPVLAAATTFAGVLVI